MFASLPALLLLAAAGLRAEPFPSCVRQTSESTYVEPVSLRALTECHGKKMERFISNYESQHDDMPSEKLVERWEDGQRREVQDFIRRHPGLAALDGPALSSGKKGRRRDPKGPGDSMESKKGITPDMASEVINTITDQQGFVSSELGSLLNAVQKDGAVLSAETLGRLKAAARKAKVAGLELKLDDRVERLLLREENEKSEGRPPKPSPDLD